MHNIVATNVQKVLKHAQEQVHHVKHAQMDINIDKNACHNCTGPDDTNCFTCNDGYMLSEGVCRKAPTGCSGNRCDIGNDSDENLQNFTFDFTIIPTFESSTNEESGGALNFVNVGLTEDVKFDKCTSEKGGGIFVFISCYHFIAITIFLKEHNQINESEMRQQETNEL